MHRSLGLGAVGTAVANVAVVAVVALGATSVATARDLTRSREESEARGHAAIEPTPPGGSNRFALVGGTVMTAAGAIHHPGYVVVEHNQIVDVGAGEPSLPAPVRRIDVAGKFITPGLIDAHSHLGVYPAPGFEAHSDGNEATAPVTAGVWAEHSVWPQDPGIELAVAGGTTSMLVLPGSANLIGGRGVTLHLVPTRGSRAMRLAGAPDVVKMACGENPKRNYGGKGSAPSTRMGNLRGQREAFFAAQRYRAEWEKWKSKSSAAASTDGGSRRRSKPSPEHDESLPPARDLGLETLAAVLDGSVLAQVHCYRADDMLAMMQLADEVGFEIRAFHHALEAYKIRDLLASKQIAVATWADWWGFKIEAFDGIPENVGLLTESGARAIIKSDSAIDIQRLNQEAGKALASARQRGIALSDDQALRWITLNPAWALGVDNQIGSLEKGKRADLVVWDRHPFSVYAAAEWVFVDGALRYDRNRDQVWSDFLVGQESP
jgi:imidazolonepropionase-like amidohydrolase